MGTYSDKLKDPRWQKKRLKILERDDFKCISCGDDKSTLHVHHRIYISNNDPWDYEDETLVTLCEKCHEYERNHLANAVSELGVLVRQSFSAFTITELFHGLERALEWWGEISPLAGSDGFGDILSWALLDKKTRETIYLNWEAAVLIPHRTASARKKQEVVSE